jgi:uncharacterized membrane protein (DUF441 family)
MMPYLTWGFSTGRRHHLWLMLLVAANLAFTFGFACVVPFAAFCTILAMTLPRHDAVLLSVALWLVNQIVGFSFLHYPLNGPTLTWGVVLGTVAVLSTLAAQTAVHGRGFVTASLAGFAVAFVAYEGGLYLVSALWLGGTEDFTAPIVLRILAINTGAFAALLACRSLSAVDTVSRAGNWRRVMPY